MALSKHHTGMSHIGLESEFSQVWSEFIKLEMDFHLDSFGQIVTTTKSKIQYLLDQAGWTNYGTAIYMAIILPKTLQVEDLYTVLYWYMFSTSMILQINAKLQSTATPFSIPKYPHSSVLTFSCCWTRRSSVLRHSRMMDTRPRGLLVRYRVWKR